MRAIWTSLGLALVLLGFASNASAQNGLQRFESEIKPQIGAKSFTYGGASALGSSGFVLSDVTMVMPGNTQTGDRDSTIKIAKMTVEEIDFDRLKKDAPEDELPRFARLHLDGMTGDDETFSMLAPYGIPNVPVDMALDYRLDVASKVLTLGKLEVNLRGLSRANLALVVDGIGEKTRRMQGAMDESRLRMGSLEIEDSGLLARLLPALAQAQGATPEALIAMVTAPLAAFTANQGPATLKALDALASFIGDWKKPQGPIRIALKPAKTAAFADLEKIMTPNALSDIFGLTIDYAGTRPGAASGAAR